MATQRGRGEGTYYQDGDLFAWRLKVDGRSVVRKAKTQKELRAKVKAALREMDERGGLLSKVDRAMTTGAYLDHWLATFVKPNRARKTYRQYEQMVRLYMKPALGAIRLQALKGSDVQTMLNDLREARYRLDEGGERKIARKALANATIQTVRVVLRRALNVAIKQRLILVNPVDVTERPKAATRRERAMNPEQLRAMMSVLETDASRYAPLLTILVTTGLRITEALALQWEDVGEDARSHKVVSVRKRLEWTGGSYALEPLKTDRSRRTIPLSPVAVAALARCVPGATREGFVFRTATGAPMMERNVQRALTDVILRKAGLPHFSLHDLRRTFGSTLANAGVPVHVLQALMGHETSATTLGHYTNAFGADLASAVGVIGSAAPPRAPPCP